MPFGQRARRTLQALASDVRRPPFVRPGHFYSPQTSAADVRRAMLGRRDPVGIDLRSEEQLALAAELDWSAPTPNRWHADQDMYGAGDATVLRAMLLHFRPRRYVEVGSGLSTALALDVAEETGSSLQITCVEPYPARLFDHLHDGDRQRVKVLEQPVQDVPPSRLVSDLEPNDVFFIDSTHVVKSGSDVAWLYLHTLPLVPPGVLVHVHDVFWPFEYPDEWLHEGRDWNEIYLLHAFLLHNDAWRIRLFCSWLWQEHPERVPGGLRGERPGSIWLQRSS